jgi:hypothetical protein
MNIHEDRGVISFSTAEIGEVINRSHLPADQVAKLDDVLTEHGLRLVRITDDEIILQRINLDESTSIHPGIIKRIVQILMDSELRSVLRQIRKISLLV